MLRFLLFILISPSIFAQSIDVEYDKNRDLSRYKTFGFGESEITTPKDERQVDEASLHKWVKTALREELTEKGLQYQDSLADLTVSYVVGSMDRSDFSQLGPLGTAPNNSSQTWSRDYKMGSLIIDLNDKSNNLIWRVNATTPLGNDAERIIDQTVSSGFKKFSLKPKKAKKK